MRTSSLLASASASALLLLGVAAGPALAAPGTSAPAAEPGAVSVSSDSAAPGQTIRVSGTCPTPADATELPTVQSVTSTAFTGPETFSKTDPTAFDGTATIASDAAAGAHPVLLTCSNGTASTTVTVTGGSSPSPAPSPSPSGGGTAGGATPGGSTGGDALPAGGDALPAGGGDAAGGTGTGADTANGGAGGDVVVESQGGSDGVPWGWVTAGGIVVLGAGVGTTYALTRRSRGTGGHSGPAAA